MKTIKQALIDEIYYPIPLGLVENKLIARGLDGEQFVTAKEMQTSSYKGCLADCLVSLVQSVDVTEGDKTIRALTDKQQQMLLQKAKALYEEIGETAPDVIPKPKVHIYGRPWGL